MISTLEKIIEGHDLATAEVDASFAAMLDGTWNDMQAAGFLVALRCKGETASELHAAATHMRHHAKAVLPNIPAAQLLDIVGTGGDGNCTFNVSIGSAFIAAAAGAKVAKHGAGAISSSSGAADLLRHAGVNMQMSHADVARSIDCNGFGFLFAPNHHPMMKNFLKMRQALGIRTIFNLLGPLLNPVGAKNTLLGVFSKHWLEPYAQALIDLKFHRALVVHSQDGMDEISSNMPTDAMYIADGKATPMVIDPREYGLPQFAISAIRVANSDESLRLIHGGYMGTHQAARTTLALNAGAALFVAGRAASIADGVALAIETMASGAAKAAMENYIAYSRSVGPS